MNSFLDRQFDARELVSFTYIRRQNPAVKTFKFEPKQSIFGWNMKFALFALALAMLVCTSSAVPSSPSSFWQRGEAVNPAAPITLTFAIKQQNLDRLEAEFWRRSDPRDAAHYGHHMSFDEVNELVRPRPESSQQVREWLQANGVAPEAIQELPAGDWIRVCLTY